MGVQVSVVECTGCRVRFWRAQGAEVCCGGYSDMLWRIQGMLGRVQDTEITVGLQRLQWYVVGYKMCMVAEVHLR